MTNINKTLYIPLYGKAYVSRRGIIIRDPKAEEIWSAEGANIPLKGKSSSKWLALYMGMRSAVFDAWLKAKMEEAPDAVVIHIGCGLDSRVLRVGTNGHQWYDVDFPEVITERRRWYEESEEYHMIPSDARQTDWLAAIPEDKSVVVVMEGVSMYMDNAELRALLSALSERFTSVSLLIDCYTTFAAKASKYKNPINDVGVTTVYGIDDPHELENVTDLRFVREHDMTPAEMINQLRGMEKSVFRRVYSGSVARKMYRMYEYENNNSRGK